MRWTWRPLVALSFALAVACGGDPKEGGGTDSSNGSGGTEATDGGSSSGTTGNTNTAGGSGSAVCQGVDCGGHGSCIEVASEPRCVCDTGYVEDPDVPTCTPSGASGTSGGSSTGGNSSTSSTTGPTTITTTTTTDSGGGKPNGEPCESPDECQSGYCWSDWNWQQQNPYPKTCHEGCIQNRDYDSYCYNDGDCCNGQCQIGGQADGVCFN